MSGSDDDDKKIADFRLRYEGAAKGFSRTRKARHISIRREKGESDGDYAQRLMRAQDREYDASQHRWGYEPKSLRPEDKDFLDGFLLTQKKKLVMQASKDFDVACWDGNLTALCRCVNLLSRYFKARGGGAYDSMALNVLCNVMSLPNLNFYKQEGDDHPALQFNMPAHQQDFKTYCYLVVGAMQLYVQNAPKGMEKVQAYHGALLKRKEKGAFSVGLEHVIVLQRMEERSKERRLSFDLKDNLLNPLDWAYHEDVLDFVIKSDSPLLAPTLFVALKKVEEWERDTRQREREESSDFSHRFWGKAVNAQGMVFAGVFYRALEKALGENHPSTSLLQHTFQKLDDIRTKQMEGWGAQKNDLELSIKHMRRELDEKRESLNQSWGMPKKDH